ncbi:MAG: HPt (histidine-containing phosphotransfer) domain-containing protein [Rickettsiales bacterium]|jgi:HPt (histidine-containing phosphotransfer) domain-containing protein
MTTKETNNKVNGKDVGKEKDKKDIPSSTATVDHSDSEVITPDQEPAIDLNYFREVTKGDLNFEKEVFILYLDTTKNTIKQMEDAIVDKSNAAWRKAAHSIKGSSTAIGAFNLSEAIIHAQNHPKDSAENKMKTLDRIKTQLEKVYEFIYKEISETEKLEKIEKKKKREEAKAEKEKNKGA